MSNEAVLPREAFATYFAKVVICHPLTAAYIDLQLNETTFHERSDEKAQKLSEGETYCTRTWSLHSCTCVCVCVCVCARARVGISIQADRLQLGQHLLQRNFCLCSKKKKNTKTHGSVC